MFSGSTHKSRIVAATASQAGERAWLIVVRLFEAPLFLVYWGAHLWGEWLLLTAFIQYLQLANLGIGNAGQSEAIMAVGAGDTTRALSALQTVHAALWGLCLFVLALALLGLATLDPARHLGLTAMNPHTAQTVILVVLCQLILKLQLAIPYAALASVGRYALASLLTLVTAILEFLPVAVLLPLGYGPGALALAIATGTLLGFAAFWIAVFRFVPWMTFGWSHASRAMLSRLWRPSLGMAAMNFGTLLNVQGFRIAAGMILGPSQLAVLAVLRTFGQTLVQLGTIVPFAVRPELSAAYGRHDTALFQRLAYHSMRLALWPTFPVALAGMALGTMVISIWTGGRIETQTHQVFLVLGAAMLELFWRATMSPMIAINRHGPIASSYLAIYGLLTVVLTGVLSKMTGLDGPLYALLTIQALMAVAVPYLSWKTYGETRFLSWLRAVASPPTDLIMSLRKLGR